LRRDHVQEHGDPNPGLFLLYRNKLNFSNSPPVPPAGLSASVSVNDVTFSWNAALDAETPSPGLSYNLRVGTSPGGCEIVSPHSDGATGFRRVPALGNAQGNLSWTVKRLSFGTYTWSVQSIDAGFSGSTWASERTVTVP
jgi:hypothetical protein